MKVKVYYKSKLVPPGFSGITLWHIFLKNTKSEIKASRGAFGLAKLINHEEIHAKQQRELLVLPFFILYLLFYLLHFAIKWNWYKAYMTIPFEREAYKNQENIQYLDNRAWCRWIKYI